MKNKAIGRHDILLIPAVLVFAAVAFIGVLSLSDESLWPVVVGLLAIFGIAFFTPEFKPLPHWVNHLRMAVATLATFCLILTSPGWGVFPILFFMLGPQAMVWYSQKIGLLWAGIFTLVTLVAFMISNGIVGIEQSLVYIPGFWFFAIFGWMMRQAMIDKRRSDQLLVELQQTHRQLQEYVTRVEEMTIVQERNRIAREMHDSLGHRLTVVSVQLEGAQRLIAKDPTRAEGILATVREQVREGLTDLRSTVAMLHAPVEEDLPLNQALHKLSLQIEEAFQIEIHLILDENLPALSATTRHALFRAAQEGLTNIQRHASASEAWIQVSWREEWVTLLVGDNGKGIADQPEDRKTGYGLTGLRERATALGGEFYVDPRPGGGTQLTFRLPIVKETAHEPADTCL